MTASRQDTFTCLQCGERLVLKRGEVRSAHFAHLNGAGCGGERVTHLLAKRLLVALLRGGHAPVLSRACASAGCEARLETPWALPPFDAVEEEVPCGAFRLDVALLRDGVVVAGIEVFFSSRMSRFKQMTLAVPWVELDAEELLSDPLVWRPLTQPGTAAGSLQLHQRSLQRYRSGMPLSRLRDNPKVLDTARRYLQARFAPRSEALRPASPWICPACEEEVAELGELVVEEEGFPATLGAGHAGPGRERAASLPAAFVHAWVRELVPELYGEGDADRQPEEPEEVLPPQAPPVLPVTPLSPEEEARRAAGAAQAREEARRGRLALQAELDPRLVAEVLGEDDLRAYRARPQVYRAALDTLPELVTDLRGIENNCFVPRPTVCACGSQAPLVWTEDEVFYPETLRRLLNPRPDPLPPLGRTLPPRRAWQNVCPDCGAALALPLVNWRVFLPGRVLGRLLRARGAAPREGEVPAGPWGAAAPPPGPPGDG